MFITKYCNEQTSYFQSTHCAGSKKLAQTQFVESQKKHTIHNPYSYRAKFGRLGNQTFDQRRLCD